MSATTKKTNYSNLKQQAEKDTSGQIDDIFSQISALGSTTAATEPVSQESYEQETVAEEPVIRRSSTPAVTKVKREKKQKEGYVSLVIPDSTKTKWKLFSTEHGISLTDSIKLGMKLLAEMEEQKLITIDDGVITLHM